MDYIKLYNEKRELEAQEALHEAVQQLDEVIILTAIAAALAAGVIFRTIDSIRGQKPTVAQYIKGLITWAFSEYSDGSLSVNDIRKAAYDTMKEDKELEEEFGQSFSKILSKKILTAVGKGSREFAKVLGDAIGRVAIRAKMSTAELNKILQSS